MSHILTDLTPAEELLAKGLNVEAFHFLMEQKRLSARDPIILTRIADLMIEAGRPRTAVEIYQQVLAANHTDPSYRINLLFAQTLVMDFLDMRKLRNPLDNIASAEYLSKEAWLKVSKIYQRLGLHNDAVRSAKKSMKSGSDRATVLVTIAHIYAYSEQHRRATSALKKLCLLDSPPMGCMYQGLQLAEYCGNKKLSLNFAKELYARRPDDTNVLLLICRHLLRAGKPHEAAILVIPKMQAVLDQGVEVILEVAAVLSSANQASAGQNLVQAAKLRYPDDLRLVAFLKGMLFVDSITTNSLECAPTTT